MAGVVYKLSDYQVLDFFVTHVDLELDLTQNPVKSKAKLLISPNPESKSRSTSLNLDYENMQLSTISLNGKQLSVDEYILTEHSLTIIEVPPDVSFFIETTTFLGINTDLFGLYQTEGTALVKAETEGLRRVFPCNDRPDNLSTYTTTIIANKKEYPSLLSNGVLTAEKDLENGAHLVTWTDPVPKPSYLFAMVAGNLKRSSTSYKTLLGREIPIHFSIPEEAITKCDFAKEVLKAAMKWDEQRFQLECFLPEYKVAGVNKYASGASEPLGLNLFNTANLYATPESRTDIDILRVMEVVAHEYFHTWTGDFVTIRDWFNLAAKEGLTTFRASLFMEHWLGVDMERLFSGRSFDERAPRPDSYTAVRSLYTGAAYEKSAEIFRMIMNILGEERFNKALTTFLKNNMGKAITLENILDSLSKQTNKDVRHFLSWFTEPGIPTVHVIDEYDTATKTYKLKCTTKEGKERPIPVEIMLFNNQGEPISETDTLMLDQPEAVFEYYGISERPTPSLLRNFSAPVNIQFKHNSKQLLLIMQHDNDAYSKCHAAKKLITGMIADYCADKSLEFSPEFIAAYRSVLRNNKLSTYIVAELLTLPPEEALMADLSHFDFAKIAAGRRSIQERLAQELKSDLHHVIQELGTSAEPDKKALFDVTAAGNRHFKSVCYSYLLTIESKTTEKALIAQFNSALGKNMTETISALALLADNNYSELDKLLESFYYYWQHDIDAINYWFNLQASVHTQQVVQQVEKLMQHAAFDLSNPNKVYALLGSFIKNPYGFHNVSGEGYKLVVCAILKLEQLNPTLAANLTNAFNCWDTYDSRRQELMLACLRTINNSASSADVRNMAKKGLDKIKVDPPPLPINLMFLGEIPETAASTDISVEQENQLNSSI